MNARLFPTAALGLLLAMGCSAKDEDDDSATIGDTEVSDSGLGDLEAGAEQGDGTTNVDATGATTDETGDATGDGDGDGEKFAGAHLASSIDALVRGSSRAGNGRTPRR